MTPGKAIALQTALLLIATGLGTAWTFWFHPKKPALYLSPKPKPEPGLPFAEIRSWPTPPVWIDARTTSEFDRGHLPGAVSINPENAEGQFERHFDLFIDQRKRFVVYGPPAAADTILQRLKGLGLARVYRLGEPWAHWNESEP